MTAAARRYSGSDKGRDTESAASALVRVKELMFAIWKTNTWLWEDPQTVCVKLIACLLGKQQKLLRWSHLFFFFYFKSLEGD